MGVFISIPVKEIKKEREKPSLTYYLDFESGRIIGTVDGLNAVNQAIRKAIITPRFDCLIYDNQYGSEIKRAIIAKDATRGYVETEIPRLVKDALLGDSRIIDVGNFSFSFADDHANIRFEATTIFGKTVIKEVI